MRNFNKLRKMQSGGFFGNSSLGNFLIPENPYRVGTLLPQSYSLYKYHTELGGNITVPPPVGKASATETDNTTVEDTQSGQKGNLLSKEKSSAAFGLLQLGFNMANNYLNKDLVNGLGFDTFNQVSDSVVSAVGAINPAYGAILGALQTGINGINAVGAKKSDAFSIDAKTQALMGGSYVGSYNDMAKASQMAGKKYGLFNRRGFKQALEDIAESKLMLSTIQDINQDNQSRLAMAANTLMNTMNYMNKLNGGINFNNMRIGKLGFKLENLDRCRKIKTTHVVNVDTKRIEEFKPEISDPAKMFKEGGSFTPIITDVPFVPIISEVESFKEGGTIQEELVKLEETNLKNVIPEGALHKNKHHIEHTEGLTLKGIPVIDNDGLQLAEIELNEIIFTLEVTKKLEKLHQIFKEGNKEELDKAAIEAGRLLVHEILYNTDDRTDLISKCEKGGKL